MAHSTGCGPAADHLLDGGRTPHQRLVSEDVEALGEHAEERIDLGDLDQALDPEGDLDQHLGQLVRLLADGPAPVGGLAPGRPVEAGVHPDPRRALLPGQAVGGLEADVAEEDVHLEPLLHRLTLQERGLEGVPVRTDELGEDVVQHGGAEATVLPWPSLPMRANRRRGWSVGSSTTPTRAGPGRARRRPCTPSPRPSRPGPPPSSSMSMPPRTGSWWWATTRPSIAPPTGAGQIAELPWESVRALDNAYWWVPGADVTPGLDPDRYPFRGRAPGGPPIPDRPVGGGARRVPRRGPQSGHQADRSGGGALRGGAGGPAPPPSVGPTT